MIYCFLLSLAAEWKKEPSSGKEYTLLEKSTLTLNHDINQQKCRVIGGHLPEPKDEQENQFLHSFNAQRFLLGINKNAKDQWIYDSDNSALTWVSWANWEGQDEGPFPRQDHGNCVSMVRNTGNEFTGHRSQDWANNNCASNADIQGQLKSLICQKSG